MNKKILLISILAFILLSINASAQLTIPVKWQFSQQKISDDVVLLKAKATIIDKWHMYGQYSEPAGGTPLKFEFVKSDKYELLGTVAESPKPHKEYDDIMMANIQTFEKTATFTQKIKVLSSKDFVVAGNVSGQACDQMCIQFDDDFEYNIKGVKKSGTTKTEPVIKDNTEKKDTKENVVTEVLKVDTLKIDTLELAKNDSIKENKKQGECIITERPKTTPIIVKANSVVDVNEKTSLIWFFLIAFGFGLTALITPCVFPMIPMTVSFFMHSGEGKDKRKAKMQALIYGISIVVIYTLPIAIVIGVSNMLGGDSISGDFANWLSTHWIPNIFFFLIFMVFAFSFFGMFEIQLPNWMISKSDEKADKGGLIGVFFMAFTLVLVSFSCTGPIVGGILIESTHGGTFLKPILGMMGFSLGVALPFTLFAFFPNLLQKLPKSGGWLNSVKVVLGFLELALGLKFLSIADQTYHWGLLDREVYLALWIVIFGLMGLYLLGKLKFSHDSEMPFLKVPRLIFSIIVLTFVMYLIPGMFGAQLTALSGYLPPKATMDFDLVKMIEGDRGNISKKPSYTNDLHLPPGFKGYFDYYEALQCAKDLNKPLFIDFTGHGCVNCREMEATVWADPSVKQILQEDYVIVALYVDDKKIITPESHWFTSTSDKKIKKKLGKQNADIQIVNFEKNSQPYYVLIDCEGNMLAQPRSYNLDATKFKMFLEKGKQTFKALHKENK